MKCLWLGLLPKLAYAPPDSIELPGDIEKYKQNDMHLALAAEFHACAQLLSLPEEIIQSTGEKVGIEKASVLARVEELRRDAPKVRRKTPSPSRTNIFAADEDAQMKATRQLLRPKKIAGGANGTS